MLIANHVCASIDIAATCSCRIRSYFSIPRTSSGTSVLKFRAIFSFQLAMLFVGIVVDLHRFFLVQSLIN